MSPLCSVLLDAALQAALARIYSGRVVWSKAASSAVCRTFLLDASPVKPALFEGASNPAP